MNLIHLFRLHETGPAPRFNIVHIWKTIEAINASQPISRGRLCEKVNIGEGSIRSILTILKKHGLITIKQSGVSLTRKGYELFLSIPIKKDRIQKTELTIGECNVAVHIKNVDRPITDGLKQRDEAIKVGAGGATTIIVSNGELILAKGFSVDVNYPPVARTLREKFKVENNDVVIIGTAENYEKAEEGALAAAFELLV
jgi:predicted transcriptional regulator